jgi:hypothetical protein
MVTNGELATIGETRAVVRRFRIVSVVDRIVGDVRGPDDENPTLHGLGELSPGLRRDDDTVTWGDSERVPLDLHLETTVEHAVEFLLLSLPMSIGGVAGFELPESRVAVRRGKFVADRSQRRFDTVDIPRFEFVDVGLRIRHVRSGGNTAGYSRGPATALDSDSGGGNPTSVREAWGGQ